MQLDFHTLDMQRRQHPAWRLLLADSAPLVASFLHSVFVQPNVRVMAQAPLVEALEDTLYGLRETLGQQVFPKSAQAYLNDWAANDKGWLRKFYPLGSDEPHYDLTPPTERALAWLAGLSDRSFVGTESRLLTLFGLLKRVALQAGEADDDTAALFAQVRVDKAALAAHVRQSLQTQNQVTLAALLQTRPLQQGLGELVSYLQLASESPGSVVDEATEDVVAWVVRDESGDEMTRRARLPRVIFVRG